MPLARPETPYDDDDDNSSSSSISATPKLNLKKAEIVKTKPRAQSAQIKRSSSLRTHSTRVNSTHAQTPTETVARAQTPNFNLQSSQINKNEIISPSTTPRNEQKSNHRGAISRNDKSNSRNSSPKSDHSSRSATLKNDNIQLYRNGYEKSQNKNLKDSENPRK